LSETEAVGVEDSPSAVPAKKEVVWKAKGAGSGDSSWPFTPQRIATKRKKKATNHPEAAKSNQSLLLSTRYR
jgi:hypothetical protein